MNKELLVPKVGLRFSLNGSIFEVVFIGHGRLRYSSIAGGKNFLTSIDKFYEKYDKGEIEINTSLHTELLTEEKTKNLMRKQEYIKSTLYKVDHLYSKIQVYKVIEEVSKRICDPTPPSPRTVMRWTKLYLENDKNLFSLNSVRPGNKYIRFSPLIENIISIGIKEAFLDYKENRNSNDVMAYIKGKMFEQDISLHLCPSLRTIQRRISEMDPYIVAKAKKGTMIANKIFKAAGYKKKSPFLMSVVEIDTHDLDIIVIDPEHKEPIGRPYLTCAIDTYSRCIVGFYLSMFPVNASSTLKVFKNMLERSHNMLPGGIPSLIIPDNGVEFKNSTFSRVCNELGITILPAQNRTPNDKAKIERFFGTITSSLIQKIKGTTFSNPIKRGSYDSKKNASATLVNIASYINEWINEIYHKRTHSETGRAPILLWQDSIRISPPHLLSLHSIDIITRKKITKKINHGQVMFSYLIYKSHALATFKAQGISSVTILVDETNLENVYIQDPFDTSNYILADSTDPLYTKQLSLHIHTLLREEIKQISESDRQKLGDHVTDFAYWNLINRIQSETKSNRSIKKRIPIPMPTHLQDKLDKVQFSRPNTEMKTVDNLPNYSIRSQDSAYQNFENNKQKSSETLSPFTTLELDDEE